MVLRFETVGEAKPADKWKRCFARAWPSYRGWFLGEGEAARTDLPSCRARLRRYMPELVETYERLCDLVGDDDLASRFLSMVDPPRYLAGCSQLAWTGEEPALIRNYDFSPRLFEGVMMRTQWLRPVLGVSECTWGLLDGVNADGLAICLAFGGRPVVGQGFGIPLVVRYLLETCGTVPEACERVRTVPVHMAYGITLLDAAGRRATVHLAPDRDPVVTTDATCTNHQPGAEQSGYAVVNRSVERKARLDALLEEPGQDRESLIRHFLRSPLYSDDYRGRRGTLYTAVYDPTARTAEMVWPSRRLRLGVDAFEDRTIHVPLPAPDNQATTTQRTDTASTR